MTYRTSGDPPDRVVALIAERQSGVVDTAQLHAAGLGRRAVAHRVEQGRLHPKYRGVYAVGHADLAPRGRYFAAWLACGSDALVSHEAAAHLLAFGPGAPAVVDISVVSGETRRRRRPGMRLHVVSFLDARDRTIRDGLPVTSPARTIVDLAEQLPLAPLIRIFEDARRQRLLSAEAVAAAAMRRPGKLGNPLLRRLLAEVGGPAPFTRSEAERRMLRLIATANLEAPRVNVRVAGFEVDLLWSAQRLVVEIDGYAYHGSRAAFERDRRRDARMLAAGYRVLRVSWRQITDDAEELIATLARALVA